MSQKIITINGTTYDAHTGLPVGKTEKVASVHPPLKPKTQKAHHSHEMHARTQKSHTLNRRVVKKAAPTGATPVTRQVAAKSQMITRFAPHPTNAVKKHAVSDIAPTSHPLMQKTHQRMAAKPQVRAAAPTHHTKAAVKATPKPSAVIKQEAISEALAKAPSHHAKSKTHHSNTKNTSRIFSIASASLALLLLGGYFTYLNMPNLSVRVAAAQAGIDATYPAYRPDGYSLRGPVAYNQGEVSMKFAANAGPQNFTITQTKSSFDSSAVEENYVKPKWGENSMKQIERGITIYAHEGNAVWVNDGILYEIEGDATLSSSQIRGIATSL